LRGDYELDEVGRRRALAILSVLSGERAASAVIEEERIAAETYYELEARALYGMVEALVPGASREGKLPELENQVRQLTLENRRLERLLAMTRQAIKHVPFMAKDVGLGQRRMRGWRRTESVRQGQRQAIEARTMRHPSAHVPPAPAAPLTPTPPISASEIPGMRASMTPGTGATTAMMSPASPTPTSTSQAPAKIRSPESSSTPTPDGGDAP
jgi:hypothetical protein